MVRFVFTVEDLARMRFAISPMWELVHSLLALRDPSTAALHLPWLKSLSGRLDGIALEPAVALIAVRGYSPDFINPPPASPLGDIADDLVALRATPDDLIRHDIALWKSQHDGVSVGTWLDDPRGTVAALADTLEAYWEVAMAPVWPRVRAFLEADVAHRAGRLAEGGQAALFADLHPAVRWADGSLEVEVSRHEAVKDLAGRGLLLMPSAFKWDGRARSTGAVAADRLLSRARDRDAVGRGRRGPRRAGPRAGRDARGDPHRARRAALHRASSPSAWT